MKPLFVILFTFLFITFSFGQDFGAHPNGQDWKILNSPAIRIIYPEGMEDRAQRVANIINYMNTNNTQSVGQKQLKLDLVMQNRTTIPNGYVGLAPARSEFFCTPPQSNLFVGSLNWLDILAVHEFRHVQQTANTKHGLTKFMYFFSGQSGWQTANSFSLPNWYFEGDAVITETALTTGGRGRAPFFTKELRALAHDNKNFRYLKMRNGSFKSLLPNHYPLGYMMLAQARKEKGNDVTATVLRQAAAYKGIIYPFSRAMKRNVGYNTTQLYNVAWQENKKNWAEELKEIQLTPTTPVTEISNGTVTSYKFPRFLSDGSIVVNKSSFNKTNALYHIKDGEENEISTIGASYDDYISVGRDIVAWTEIAQDARRANLNYSDIVLYDTKNKERKRLTHKTRYFSPSISPNGSALATIHITFEQNNEIHILNPNTGELVKKIANPQNYFLSRLAWVNENELISIAKNNNRIALVKFNLQNNTITELTPWSSHTIEGLSVQGENVYFNAAYTGIDNIFRVNVNGSKKIYQMTSVPVGAYEPTISHDGKTLIFTELNSTGYYISKVTPATVTEPYIIYEPNSMPRYSTIANKSEGGDILEKFGKNNYDSKPYNQLFRGMKLHSWNVSPSFTTPSVRVQLNNILNDVSLVLGGGINRNEANNNFYNATLKIGRYFTETDFDVAYQIRQTDFYSAADTIAQKSFNEISAGMKLAIPLKWRKGNFTNTFNTSVGYTHRALSNVKAEGRNLANDNLGSFDIKLLFSTLRRTAIQNVGTRLGFSTNLQYTQSLNRSNEKIEAHTKAYLPGLGLNHNLVLRGAYQKELLSNPYQYADVFEYPRGFQAPINDQFTLFSANYGLPLFYPDWGFGGITYFKRVRANLFYDTGIAKKGGTSKNYSSTGFELIFDNTHLNFMSLSLGLRTSYLLEGVTAGGKKTNISIFLSTTLE